MNVHIQRRCATSAIPPLRSRQKWCSARVRALVPDPEPEQERGADRERGGVDGDRGAGAVERDQDARGGRAEDHPTLRAIASIALPCCRCSCVATIGTRPPARAGSRRRRCRTAPRADDVPELRLAGEQERGERGLHGAAPEVGHDHQVAPVHAVRPHPRGEDQHRHRQRLRGEHEPELRRRAVQVVQDRERQRDRQQRVAEDRHRLPAEQQPELPEPQDRGHGRIVLVAHAAGPGQAEAAHLGDRRERAARLGRRRRAGGPGAGARRAAVTS